MAAAQSDSVLDGLRVDPAQITLAQKLGSGGFGDVYRGTLKLSTGQVSDVAVKVIPRSRDAPSVRARRGCGGRPVLARGSRVALRQPPLPRSLPAAD